MQRLLAFTLALVLFLSPAPLRPEAPPVAETPGFLLGVNYVPSHDWHTTLENWDPAAVDADLAALSRIGVKCLRVFPLWIYRAFKEADPATPVTNGIGTGFDPRFNTRAIARSSDFLSVHSYPQFHRTNLLDPPLDMRTTYGVNFITAWAMAEGKPVLTGWEDRLPVVCVLSPATDEYFRTMLDLIQPFVRAKRRTHGPASSTTAQRCQQTPRPS